jgi:hypothetical protein
MKNQKWLLFVCLILVIFVAATISLAQEKDEELKKKYSAILGDYEFDLTEYSMDVIILNFHIQGGELWGDSGDGNPITLEPAGDEPFEFTSDDPDSGALEIKFEKDDEGEYSICHINLLDQGVEITGYKIK